MGDVSDYATLNVQARLAAGLLTVEAWLGKYQIDDAATTAVLDHMWQFMTVTPETFGAWYDWQPPALLAAEAEEPVLSSAEAECAKHGASPHDLATMLADVVNIVYDSLFGALDLSRSMTRLKDLAAVAARSNVVLTDAAHFGHLAASQRHGWGNPASSAQVAELRSQERR